MKEPYLEVTFRHGRPIAAYYYLPRRPGQKSYRAKRVEPGLVVDLSRRARPIGIEITAPRKVSVAALNRHAANGVRRRGTGEGPRGAGARRG